MEIHVAKWGSERRKGTGQGTSMCGHVLRSDCMRLSSASFRNAGSFCGPIRHPLHPAEIRNAGHCLRRRIAVLAWSTVATAILLMDSSGPAISANRPARSRPTRCGSTRCPERDARAAEAVAAQDRFNAALRQVSVMQSELLDSETRRRELETGIDVMQATLREAIRRAKRPRDRLAVAQRYGEWRTGRSPWRGRR